MPFLVDIHVLNVDTESRQINFVTLNQYNFLFSLDIISKSSLVSDSDSLNVELNVFFLLIFIFDLNRVWLNKHRDIVDIDFELHFSWLGLRVFYRS